MEGTHHGAGTGKDGRLRPAFGTRGGSGPNLLTIQAPSAILLAERSVMGRPSQIP
jgi:hypothetical protein